MELGDHTRPVTRGQLDIWLAQETRNSGTEWQLGLFVRIDDAVERDALHWAIRRLVGEVGCPGRGDRWSGGRSRANPVCLLRGGWPRVPTAGRLSRRRAIHFRPEQFGPTHAGGSRDSNVDSEHADAVYRAIVQIRVLS